MSQIKIEPFENKNVQDIKNLMEYLDYFSETSSIQKRIENFLVFPLNKIYLAKVKSSFVGYIALAFHHLIVTKYYRCRIENLVVDPLYRRQGVGQKLVAFSECYALSCQSSIIDVTSSMKREKEGTHTFYKALGFQNEGPEERLYFRKKLILET